jgi:hypothetical protein
VENVIVDVYYLFHVNDLDDDEIYDLENVNEMNVDYFFL